MTPISLLASHWRTAWPLDAQAALWAGVYVLLARRVRGGWPRWRTLSFLAGIAAVVVALQSGVAADDERLLSAHMAQHMLLLLVAPLLLLLGRPAELALRACGRRPRRSLARALAALRPLTGPPVCLAAYTAVLIGSHVPAFYEATLRHPALHALEHGAYLTAGLLLWWPIVGADPSPARRPGGLGRLLYLLATMPAMALVGAWLTRSSTLVYPAYGPPARALGISALADQAQAGAIMWVLGSSLTIAAGLWAVMHALVQEERRQRRREGWPSNRPYIPVRRPAPVGEGRDE